MALTNLTGVDGIVAVAAAALALVAVAWCLATTMRLRGLRRDQGAVLGDGRRDLVAHAADLQAAFEALHDYVSDAAQRLEGRLDRVELELQGAISHRALVRYDAYNELSGRQSVSIALLDDTESGIVMSCIHHRDQARVYAKRLIDGAPERELSPEESEAVQLAMSTEEARRDGMQATS